ncbi:hypothetical protein D910_00808 [Dendroctonus ponderosae]|uniref:Peptidyl-prolyl cis-trans isomerase n=1 Tax=Dendroctonus ponderosae TaxID=77166 RepID=U4V011_DENPD|nr:hypothetical protein D910_00808 [Dendroctonus ponderosae]
MHKIVMFLVISFAIKQSMQKNYKVTDQIYMDIEIDGKYSGRVTFGLFGETVPKTVKNFKQIALQGIEGNGYTGTRFLLAIKKVMILGGDIVYNNGSGAASIYGERFEDENFEIEPDSTGLLAMANLGGSKKADFMGLDSSWVVPTELLLCHPGIFPLFHQATRCTNLNKQPM